MKTKAKSYEQSAYVNNPIDDESDDGIDPEAEDFVKNYEPYMGIDDYWYECNDHDD